MAGKWKHRDVQAPRLRILLDPIYIQAANLLSSSTYNRWSRLVKILVERGHYVYWMVPDSNYENRPDSIENHPNVGIIRTDYIQDQFVIDGLVSTEFFNLFNRIAGKYHVDIVVTGRTGAASMIRKVLESPRYHDKGKPFTDKHYKLPMAIIEGFPQTPDEQFVGEPYWLGQCQGYLTADCTFFLSEHNRSSVVRGMTGIYTHSTIQRFIDKTMIVPTGVHLPTMRRLRKPDRWKLEKQFRVISVGRLMSTGGRREYLSWFDYIYKSGVDAKIIVSLAGSLGGPTAAALAKMGVVFDENNPQFELKLNNPRENFLKLLNTVHAGIVPVEHYDSPAGPSEALYMGVPLIMPKSDYQKTFFPDYPYAIDPGSKEQLLACLQEIKDDPQAARDRIEPWRGMVEERLDIVKNTVRMADKIEEIARDPLPKFKTSGAILDFLSELKGERYTFADIVAYLRKCGRMGISIGDLGIRATWTYGRGTIHHAMRYVGYVDLCDGPDEVFVRRDVFENMAEAAKKKRKPRRRKRK